jgi:anti-sigma factor RsiW
MNESMQDERLSGYLDGELSAEDRLAFETDLQRTPSLQMELAQLESSIQAFRTFAAVEAPPAVQTALREALLREPMAVGGAWWNARPFGLPVQGLAVGVVAIAAIGVALSQGRGFWPEDLSEREAVHAAATEVKEVEDRSDDGAYRAEEELVQPAAAPVSEKLYGGVELHTIAVRPQDLKVVATLLQQHGARDVDGTDAAERVLALTQGQHTLPLRLPTLEARDALARDVRSAFAGRHSEKREYDGVLSTSGAQVGLVIVVSSMATKAKSTGARKAAPEGSAPASTP